MNSVPSFLVLVLVLSQVFYEINATNDNIATSTIDDSSITKRGSLRSSSGPQKQEAWNPRKSKEKGASRNNNNNKNDNRARRRRIVKISPIIWDDSEDNDETDNRSLKEGDKKKQKKGKIDHSELDVFDDMNSIDEIHLQVQSPDDVRVFVNSLYSDEDDNVFDDGSVNSEDPSERSKNKEKKKSSKRPRNFFNGQAMDSNSEDYSTINLLKEGGGTLFGSIVDSKDGVIVEIIPDANLTTTRAIVHNVSDFPMEAEYDPQLKDNVTSSDSSSKRDYRPYPPPNLQDKPLGDTMNSNEVKRGGERDSGYFDLSGSRIGGGSNRPNRTRTTVDEDDKGGTRDSSGYFDVERDYITNSGLGYMDDRQSRAPIPTPAPTTDIRKCSNHPLCRQLEGDCCPSSRGIFLDCCNLTDTPNITPSPTPTYHTTGAEDDYIDTNDNHRLLLRRAGATTITSASTTTSISNTINQRRDRSKRRSLQQQEQEELSDEFTIIDILVLYTPNAVCGIAGKDNGCSLDDEAAKLLTLGKINLAVQETNQAYENSKINMRLRLVHTALFPYTENNVFSDALTELRLDGTRSDGTVANMRSQYGADLVHLIINNGQFCGMANFADTKDWGFAITHHTCATGYYSFGHEVGHNIQCMHDRATGNNNNCDTGGSYNYGYRDPQSQFRTIMSYACKQNDCDVDEYVDGATTPCTRIQYFSNPDVRHQGKVVGVEQTNNAKQINERGKVVASWFNTATNLVPPENSKPGNLCTNDSDCDDGNCHTKDICFTSVSRCFHTWGKSECSCNVEYIKITILMDYFPEDISWFIKDIGSNKVLYEKQYVYEGNEFKTYSYDLALCNNQQYYFELNDKYGDALTVERMGYVEIKYENEVILYADENFQFQVKKTFNIPYVPPVPTDAPVPAPPGPTPNLQCNQGESAFEVVTLADDYTAADNSWVLTESDSGNIIASKSYEGAVTNTIYRSEFNLCKNKKYTFKLSDEYGDGTCCSWGEGYVRLISEGRTILTADSNFGNQLTYTFDIPSCETTTLKLAIQLDLWADDNAWFMKQGGSNNANILYGGISYREDDQNKLYEYDLVVCVDETYYFELTDSWGDSLCCDHGNGFVKLMNNGDELLYASNKNDGFTSDGKKLAYTFNLANDVDADCLEETVLLTIKLDDWPEDYSWFVRKNYDNSAVKLYQTSYKDVDNVLSLRQQLVQQTLTLCASNDYYFELTDSFGDGFAVGDGYVELKHDDTVIFTEGGTNNSFSKVSTVISL